MGEHLRRVLLSLSAYEFQRGYWFGGVLVLMALFFSEAGTEASPTFFSEFFAFKRIAWVAVGALLAPLVFTLLSELTFLCILRCGEAVHEPLGRFVQSTIERTESEETRQDGGGTSTAREVAARGKTPTGCYASDGLGAAIGRDSSFGPGEQSTEPGGGRESRDLLRQPWTPAPARPGGTGPAATLAPSCPCLINSAEATHGRVQQSI